MNHNFSVLLQATSHMGNRNPSKRALLLLPVHHGQRPHRLRPGQHPFMTGSGVWSYFAPPGTSWAFGPSTQRLCWWTCIPGELGRLRGRPGLAGAVYHITVQNPCGVEGIASVSVNGRPSERPDPHHAPRQRKHRHRGDGIDQIGLRNRVLARSGATRQSVSPLFKGGNLMSIKFGTGGWRAIIGDEVHPGQRAAPDGGPLPQDE